MKRRLRLTSELGLIIGLLATAGVTGLQAFGLLERLELISLDMRFQYANRMRADPRIVCIDIDNTSLASVGRWPWPRDVQAALVALPAEFGARAILVDITWNEPEPVALALPGDSDMLDDPAALRSAELGLIQPDARLAQALRGAGNAFLAFDSTSRDIESSEEFREAAARLRAGDEAGAAARLDALRSADTRPALRQDDPRLQRLPERARVLAWLRDAPAASEAQIAERLGDAVLVRGAFPRLQQAALRWWIDDWLDADPAREALAAPALMRQIELELSARMLAGESALRDALALALRHVLGERATLRKARHSRDHVGAIAERADAVTPIYHLHAQAAARCGLVNFEPDLDGVVRRLPLFVSYRDAVIGQLGLDVACAMLDVDPRGMRARSGLLEIPRAADAAPLRVQVDGRGRALVPWLPQRDWTRQFTHLGADDLVTLQRFRERLLSNERTREAALRVLLAAQSDAAVADADVLAAIEAYERQWLELRDAPDGAEMASLLAEQIAGLRAQVAEIEARVAPHSDGVRQAEPEEVGAARAQLSALRETQTQLRTAIAEYEARLRLKLNGKICLIGYTATSLADMKPIPTSRSAAGVMGHANLLNGLLTGTTVRWASPAANGALSLGWGVLVCVASAWLRPRVAFGVFALALVAHLLLAIGAFWWRLYWLALAGPLLAMALSYLLIATYRFVFVDRERRTLSTALGQYTSRQIARQVAEDPQLAQRAEEREVTAIFTDLRGFTTISERIGAERTQRVLNVCLGRFVDVMLRHEAMVNKFIGDGIFAFWNPVIHPQADHARRACETALDLCEALTALRDEQRAADGDPAFQDLELRIGIATGRAVVGPCGSEQKYDYTCIGDTVNLAARLESGNKFYGTRILVNGTAAEQAGAGFEYRALGGVQAKGKTRAVPVFELLGRVGSIEPARRARAEAFAAAVARFQARDFHAALHAFETLHQQDPGDPAAAAYFELSARLLGKPPPADWNGAIELVEK